MSKYINVQGYLETVNAPWGKLFYKLVWHNIDCTKTEADWISNMYNLECTAEEIPEFRNVAFFHHVILKHIL